MALRMLVELRVLLGDSTCVLEVKPGKLDIKRCEPSIMFILTNWFTLQNGDYDVIIDFRVISKRHSKMQRHIDLIKIRVVRCS